ncbi:MAG: SUMF1/EgtB/PvdO family nonheme iron enzyme [SAR324 cluster bacterium]|nr:SUMF1/EgtB/PvdO family nonheme iron enzyme [SAR324 cluster bacterium]
MIFRPMFGSLFSAFFFFIIVFSGYFSTDPSFADAAETQIESDLDDAVEVLVEQMETQIEPFLKKNEFPTDARLLIFNLKHRSSGKRWHFSQALENQLIEELRSETDFVIIHPQKTEAFMISHWRELEQGSDHQVAIQIAEALEIPLLLMGTFDFREKVIRLDLKLFSVKSEEIFASMHSEFARENTPLSWQGMLPIYQNTAHLEIGRAFIAKEEWELAEKELKQVIHDSSPQSIEAQGLLIWIAARLGQPISEKLIPFKTRFPRHPLLPHIEHEQRKQSLIKKIGQVLKDRKWLQAKQLLDSKTFKDDDPELRGFWQKRLEEQVIDWIRQILDQKDWYVLKEQWQILLKVIQFRKANPVIELEQLIGKTVSESLQDHIRRNDRLESIELLEETGRVFLSNHELQSFTAAIAAIPLPPEGMVLIPSATFQMGWQNGEKNERPPHKVTLPAFFLDQHEVSNQQYRACVDAVHCTSTGGLEDQKFNGDRQPVVGVKWHQAEQYCDWQKKRLPTEAEWERAVEAGDYYFRAEVSLRPLNEYAWFRENSGDRSRAVKTRKANRFGVYDLLGNALEWVEDYYAADYYAWSPELSPQGPDSGELKVARGGSWFHDGASTCLHCRFYWSPTLSFNFIGFRCAVSLE